MTALIGLPLVGGCATQSYQPAPLDPPAEAAAFAERRLDAPALRRFAQAVGARSKAWPAPQWDADALFTAALFYRDEFADARAQWRALTAGVTTASRRPPLTLSLELERHSETERGESPWTVGALLDVVLPGPGRRAATIDAAQARAVAGRAALGAAAWRTRADVYRDYLAWQRLRRRVRLLGLERQALAEATQMLERRQSLGQTGGLAVSTMRLRLQRARLELASAQSAVGGARLALAASVGIPAAALEAVRPHLAEPAGALPDPEIDVLRSAGLQARYDLAGALAEYALADAELRAAVADQYPDITLSPGFLFDQDDRIWVLDAAWLLKLPGYNDGPIAAARAQRDAAAAQFRALQAAVIGDLEQALARYRGRRNVLATADAVLTSQREQSRQVQARFDAGYVGRLDLLTAKIETLAARQARHDAWIDAWQALAALESAAQTSVRPEVSAAGRIQRFVNGVDINRANQTQ